MRTSDRILAGLPPEGFDTQAQTELATVRAERDAFKVEYESRAIWIAKMNAILGYDNSDGFHSSPDPFELAHKLKSSNGKLIDAIDRYLSADGYSPNAIILTEARADAVNSK